MGLKESAAKFNEGQAGTALTSASTDLAVATDSGANAMLFDHVKFNQAWRVAQLFANTSLVPKHFQQKPEDIFIALNLSNRLGVDPLMLMQNLYVVHGTPGYYSKFVIAMVNDQGPFSGPIQWEMSGEGDSRKCIAYATHKKTGERCEAEVTWAMAKAEGWVSNSKWQSMPEMMFKYRSAAFLARLYCPGVIMGFKTVDEIEDMGPAMGAVSVSLDPEPGPDDDVPFFDKVDVEQPAEVPDEPKPSSPPASAGYSFEELDAERKRLEIPDEVWLDLMQENDVTPRTRSQQKLGKLADALVRRKSAPLSLSQIFAETVVRGEMPEGMLLGWVNDLDIDRSNPETHTQEQLEILQARINDHFSPKNWE